VSIVVTGASGSLGRLSAESLLKRIPPSDLILVTRTPETLAALAQRGVAVRYGDFDDPPSLTAAFAGARRMLLISTVQIGERRCRQHQAALEAALRAGVEHLVYTSASGIHVRNPAFIMPDHLATEELLRHAGLSVTLLRNAGYSEVVVTQIAPKAVISGQWVTSAGEGCVGFVSKHDCAECAAVVLTTSGHEGAVYEITGPELLSYRDAARIASEVTGKPIRYVVERDDEAHGDNARSLSRGLSFDSIGPYSRSDLLSYERAVREGYFAICAHHVQLITGRPAVPLADVFRAHQEALRAHASSSDVRGH